MESPLKFSVSLSTHHHCKLYQDKTKNVVSQISNRYIMTNFSESPLNCIELKKMYDKCLQSLHKNPTNDGILHKLHQPAASPAAPHPGYSISEDRLRYCRSDGSAQYQKDGDIQSLMGSAEMIIENEIKKNNCIVLSKKITKYCNEEKNNN